MAKNYTTYNETDFATDPSFVAWVKGDAKASKFWEVWLKQHPEKQETIAVAKTLVRTLSFKKMPAVSSQQTKNLWHKIEMATSDTPIKKLTPPTSDLATATRRKGLTRWVAYAAAACAAALLFFWIANPNKAIQLIETPSNNHLTHYLPDSSKVILNAFSSLEYDAKQWQTNRVINLTGEAFFEVKKGATFEVNTSIGKVSVLGTSFNVDASNENSMQVDCFSGKVKVSHNTNSKNTILTKWMGTKLDQSANFTNYEFDNNAKKAQWQEFSHFKSTPIQKVFQIMEQQFGVDIALENGIGTETYNGRFYHKDLKSALHNVCWPMNLKYTINGTQVIISEIQ